MAAQSGIVCRRRWLPLLPTFLSLPHLQTFRLAQWSPPARNKISRQTFSEKGIFKKNRHCIQVEAPTPLPKSILSPVSSTVTMIATPSVRGWVKLCNPRLMYLSVFANHATNPVLHLHSRTWFTIGIIRPRQQWTARYFPSAPLRVCFAPASWTVLSKKKKVRLAYNSGHVTACLGFGIPIHHCPSDSEYACHLQFQWEGKTSRLRPCQFKSLLPGTSTFEEPVNVCVGQI